MVASAVLIRGWFDRGSSTRLGFPSSSSSSSSSLSYGSVRASGASVFSGPPSSTSSVSSESVTNESHLMNFQLLSYIFKLLSNATFSFLFFFCEDLIFDVVCDFLCINVVCTLLFFYFFFVSCKSNAYLQILLHTYIFQLSVTNAATYLHIHTHTFFFFFCNLFCESQTASSDCTTISASLCCCCCADTSSGVSAAAKSPAFRRRIRSAVCEFGGPVHQEPSLLRAELRRWRVPFRWWGIWWCFPLITSSLRRLLRRRLRLLLPRRLLRRPRHGAQRDSERREIAVDSKYL